MNLELGARRRILAYGAGFIVLSLVQLTMTVGDYYLLPDFLFLIPLLAAMWTPGYDGFALGLAAGFLRDYAAGRGYGPGMLVGLLLGLLGNAVARSGWRQYAIRGSVLVVLSTVFHELFLSLFSWILPFLPTETRFLQVLRVSFSRMPRLLLSNMVGALILTGYFTLCLHDWKSKLKKQKQTPTLSEAQHGR